MSALIQTLPPENHPNYRLWSNYAEFAKDRGRLVCDILESFQPLNGLKILDVGCGEGGSSLAVAERGAQITAIDFDPRRVSKFRQKVFTAGIDLSIEVGNAQNLNFPNEAFDCILLQDVLEHLPYPEKAVQEINRVLKRNGLVYISTPNRWSPLNFISDPHWNLPIVSVLPRKGATYFITKIIQREKFPREDFAALLSIFKIRHLFKNANFTLTFVNKRVAGELFTNPQAVVNSELHLKVVKLLKKLKLQKLILSTVNDKFGFFNALFNPTWYLVARKIDRIDTICRIKFKNPNKYSPCFILSNLSKS
ncbi:methyltransferase domain-containing protein [candidate division KSB1 bacterium]|nr:methyltransferase domain-containing protein [candidate division KSB1 bacterium]